MQTSRGCLHSVFASQLLKTCAKMVLENHFDDVGLASSSAVLPGAWYLTRTHGMYGQSRKQAVYGKPITSTSWEPKERFCTSLASLRAITEPKARISNHDRNTDPGRWPQYEKRL